MKITVQLNYIRVIEFELPDDVPLTEQEQRTKAIEHVDEQAFDPLDIQWISSDYSKNGEEWFDLP